MVLKIYCNDDVYLYKDIDKTFCRTRSYGGMMYLQFDISPDHALYKYISEETELEYDGQKYVVKGINERKTITTINAELDLSGLDSKGYATFTRKTESFYNICKEILEETGWSIVNSELISKRTTIELTDVTPREILEHCTNSTVYNTCYSFDTINKKIYCIKPQNSTTPTGTYFTDELNLTDMAFKGSSSSLITKLYAFGKDGLDISSVNGGKRYIENHTYTDKVIIDIWRDERYTNAQSLYDDAVVKLAALAVPDRSYTVKIIDLAKVNPDKYSNILSFDLYDIVTLIDRKRKARINHRIVEIKEYLADATLNTVTLSTVPAKVTSKLQTLANKVTALDAQSLHNHNKVNEIKQDLDTTVLHVSDAWASSENQSMFTQTAEGLYLEVEKVIGTNRWSTLLQQSATDVKIAWNNISNYIKFESGQINIYSASNKKLMSLSNSGLSLFDYVGARVMTLYDGGQRFFCDDSRVGRIGTSTYSDDDSKKGLVFHLNHDSAFMSWCWLADDANSSFTMKFTYAAKTIGSYLAEQLHAGCDLNLHNYGLHNAVLKDWSFQGGSISGTWSGNIVTSFNSDGTAATWRSFSLTFKNGILQSASW